MTNKMYSIVRRFRYGHPRFDLGDVLQWICIGRKPKLTRDYLGRPACVGQGVFQTAQDHRRAWVCWFVEVYLRPVDEFDADRKRGYIMGQINRGVIFTFHQ